MAKKPVSNGRLRNVKQHSSEQVELVRVSLDEFNLATFPVSVLDKKAQRGREPLHFHDVITVAGRELERHWKVFPHQEEGFPGPADDDVLMALFELTREQGGNKKIFFTRYQLCKKLGWPLNTFYYKRIESSFRKLAAVHIEATNAYADQERKKFINMGFTIIQEYKLFDESAGREKLSYVLWSDRIAASISQKLTKTLDASFYFEELETPLEKRLFRFLDSHFEESLRQLALNIYDLCYEHLGIARRYGYISQLMQKLESPLQKLVEKGFLVRWRLEGETLFVSRAEEFATRVRLSIPYSEMLEDIGSISPKNSPTKLADAPLSNINTNASGNIASNKIANPNPSANSRASAKTNSINTNIASASVSGSISLTQDLIARGIEASVANDITTRVVGYEREVLAAIQYFDTEISRGKKFANPAGLLVSLIRKALPADQVPPTRTTTRSRRKTAPPVTQQELSFGEEHRNGEHRTTNVVQDEKALRARAEIDYQEYLIEMGHQAFEDLSLEEQKSLLWMVSSELQSGVHASKYKRMSAEKFAEHLRALVETQLSRMHALPFEVWFQQWSSNSNSKG